MYGYVHSSSITCCQMITFWSKKQEPAMHKGLTSQKPAAYILAHKCYVHTWTESVGGFKGMSAYTAICDLQGASLFHNLYCTTLL